MLHRYIHASQNQANNNIHLPAIFVQESEAMQEGEMKEKSKEEGKRIIQTSKSIPPLYMHPSTHTTIRQHIHSLEPFTTSFPHTPQVSNSTTQPFIPKLSCTYTSSKEQNTVHNRYCIYGLLYAREKQFSSLSMLPPSIYISLLLSLPF